MSTSRPFGVFVGRFSPMHLGHQLLIQKLLEEFGERHLILIGSCNHSISFRHLFSYQDRCEFIRTIFPSARILGLPDFDDDNEWFRQLDDTMAIAGIDPAQATFTGGCIEDVSFFIERARAVRIFNRFNGETPRMSATEVRDALIEHRSIDAFVDPRLLQSITQRFHERYALLRKK